MTSLQSTESIGLYLGASSLYFGVAGVLFTVLIGVASISLAIVIYLRQSAQSEELKLQADSIEELSRETVRLSREYLERTITAEVQDGDPADADPSNSLPSDPETLMNELKTAGAKLNFAELRWRKRTPAYGDKRGNYGWFVESPNSSERWFAHKGRSVTVRRAVPRDLIEAWKAETGLSPQEIRLDYRTLTSPNASWYIETYAGETWRLSKGGKAKSSITISRLGD